MNTPLINNYYVLKIDEEGTPESLQGPFSFERCKDIVLELAQKDSGWRFDFDKNAIKKQIDMDGLWYCGEGGCVYIIQPD